MKANTEGLNKMKVADPTDQVVSPASEETLQAIAGLVTDAYDYVELTYVAAGNGVGEIETAVYKSGGVGGDVVATITMTYNANHEISSIART